MLDSTTRSADPPARHNPLASIDDLLLLIVVTVGYALLSRVGELLLPPDNISALWPAAGFSAVMLLWAGTPRRRVLVLAGIVLATGLNALLRGEWYVNEVGYLVSNLIEPVVMLPFLIRATAPRLRMERLVSVAWLTGGALVATAVSGALVGAAAVWSYDGSGAVADWWPTAVAFATGDLLGVLLVAPLLLQAHPIQQLWSKGTVAEQVSLWMVLGLGLLLTLVGPSWVGVAVIAVVLIALRLDSSTASLAMLLLAGGLVNELLRGQWPTSAIAIGSVDVRGVLPVLAILVQLIALSANERQLALESRDRLLEELEHGRRVLQSVLDTAPFGVALYDVHAARGGHRPRFALVFMNAYGMAESGVEPEIFEGAEIGDFYPDLESTGLYDYFLKTWVEGSRQEFLLDSSASETGWRGVYQNYVVPVGEQQILAAWTDITELSQAQAAAVAASAAAQTDRTTLRRALDSGLDSFAIYERSEAAEWHLVFVNAVGASRSGSTADDLIGAPPELVIPVEALAQVLPLMDLAIQTNAPQQTLADLTGSKSGWRGDFDIMVTPTPGDRVVVTWRDVSDMQAAQRSLRSAHAAAMHAATHDALTNLPNRLLIADRIATSLAVAARTHEQVALVYLDIDDFKMINDRYGHHVGDNAMLQVADRLRSMTRDGDSAARIGGDEFLLLLTGLNRSWNPTTFSDRLAAILSRPIVIDNVSLSLTASMGIALAQEHHTEPDTLMRDADLALFRSKSSGKGRMTVFAEDMLDSSIPGRPTISELSEALATGQLQVFYQPVLDLARRQVVGREALIRWQHPAYGLLPPGVFLDLAETSGLISELGQYVLRTAIADLVVWDRDGWVSVNVAPTQLLRADVSSAVAEWCQDSGVDPHRIVLELTEGQLLEATAPVVRQLNRLRELGCQIAIDDFGSGYSSLAYLESFDVDIIKIDQALITGAATARKRSLLRWLSGLAETLDCMTIVEGIEEPDQLDLVLGAGLRYGQGFLLGRPAPLPESVPLEVDQPGLD